MTNPLPKWVMLRYAELWRKFKTQAFTHEQAVKALKEKEQLVSVLLSDLKKAGWLSVGLDPKDTRLRNYTLLAPEQAVKEIKK